MAPLDAFVTFQCLCGKSHTLLREKVLEGLGVSHWKCAGCKRRFVVACVPGSSDAGEDFWPVYLDNVPATGSTVQEGSTTDLSPGMAADEIHFQCRCGCRLVGRSRMFGKPSNCPKCRSGLVLTLGYKSGTRDAIPLVDYTD